MRNPKKNYLNIDENIDERHQGVLVEFNESPFKEGYENLQISILYKEEEIQYFCAKHDDPCSLHEIIVTTDWNGVIKDYGYY